MTQTVSGAVAVRQKQDQVVAWIRAQQDDIAMIAASHVKPSAIVRVTQGALRRNPKLMAAAIASPQSLLYALLDAARLGHEPDTDDYYLVPFGSEVQGIEGYKGIIERMFRAGGVSSVVAEVVRRGDAYRPRGSTTPPVHEYDDFASDEERGPMRGAYAYAILPDGRCSYVVRMGRAEIMKHKAKSRGSDKPDSPWQQWELAMWKKTVLRALEPYVPTSTEYRNAATPPEPAVFHRITNGPGVPSNAAEPVYDAELVDEREDSGPAGAEAAGPDQAAGPAPGRNAGAGESNPAATPKRLGDLYQQLSLDEDDQKTIIAWLCPAWTGSRSDIRLITRTLGDYLDHAPDAEEARSRLWTDWRKVTGQDDADEQASDE